jgi:hypothetical protein
VYDVSYIQRRSVFIVVDDVSCIQRRSVFIVVDDVEYIQRRFVVIVGMMCNTYRGDPYA